jgi:hypothetical protein
VWDGELKWWRGAISIRLVKRSQNDSSITSKIIDSEHDNSNSVPSWSANKVAYCPLIATCSKYQNLLSIGRLEHLLLKWYTLLMIHVQSAAMKQSSNNKDAYSYLTG